MIVQSNVILAVTVSNNCNAKSNNNNNNNKNFQQIPKVYFKTEIKALKEFVSIRQLRCGLPTAVQVPPLPLSSVQWAAIDWHSVEANDEARGRRIEDLGFESCCGNVIEGNNRKLFSSEEAF